MDKERFLHSYQSLKFQENDKDVFNNAIIKRKCMAMNFFASIEAGEDNTTTAALLEEDLNEYCKLVDDHGSDKVNNYADYISASLPQNQNDNQKHWKTSLTESMLTEFLKPLPCSKNGELFCRSSKITEKDIDRLKQAQNRFKNEQEYDSRSFEVKQSYSSFLPKQGISRFNSESENDSRSFEVKQSYPSFQPKQGISRNLEYKPIILKRDSTNKPKNNYEAAPEFVNKGNDERKQNPGFFKTARDELHVQSVKKYGKNVPTTSNENSHNYGGTKRTLGYRPAGVFSKFQPPVKNKEEPPPPPPPQDDEITDERLKNIDPKMIELIKNEIMDCGSTITWDDIAGLELAKTTIMEIVVWPMLRPDIFTGLRRPPKGILLFGPPGTGKTLIGKCIASQSNSTFFSISASSLTSKWIGEGEKMVRALFAVAKVHQPSVVFIDEIDSLLCQRSDTEHESSRRLKTEFLVQLDGAGTGDEDRILIIGATNRPQELDEAARRRLVRRLYIPLPDEKARQEMIKNLISKERHSLTPSEIEEIANLTKGYSGADVKNLCQEASLGPIRSIPINEIQNIDPNQVRPLNSSDFKSALIRIKSSVSEKDLDTYIAWDRQYGCGSVQ